MKNIHLKITTRTQLLKRQNKLQIKWQYCVLTTTHVNILSGKFLKKNYINKQVSAPRSSHCDTDRQTVKRQLRDRQTVERQDREWDNELSYITHRTHKRHSWTYLSSREAKRKKTIAKPSLSLSKWICFCLILLTQLIFYLIAIWLKKTVILLVCVVLDIRFYFGTFLGDLTIFIRK